MVSQIRLFLPLIALVWLAGCSGQSHEALVEEIIDNVEEFNTVLAGVSDAQSAKAAAPELKRLTANWQSIEEKLVSMDDPDEATKKRVEDMFEDRVAPLMIATMEHIMRLEEQPAVMAELADALPFGGW